MRRTPPALRVLLLLSLGLVVLSGPPTWAQPPAPTTGPSAAATSAPATSASASTSAPDAGAPEPAPALDERPDVRQLQELARQIRELLAKKLDPTVDPKSLFDIDIADEKTVTIEAKRLTAIIDRVDREKREAEAQQAAASASASASASAPPPPPKPAPSAAAPDGGTADAGAPPDDLPLREADPVLWLARITLDRARLAFYRLTEEERNAVLAAHEARKPPDDEDQKAEEELGEAERKAEKAEVERQKALEEAKKARTEAARLVAEEHARLLDISKEQAEFEGALVKREQKLKGRREARLALERRVRELIASAPPDPQAYDRLYDELRGALKDARAELTAALDTLSADESGVPAAGEDRLASLPAEVKRERADAVRKEVEAAAVDLRERERQLWHARAKELYDEMEALDDRRLELVPHLTQTKRSTVTGFGPGGLDQAVSEGRHVWLVLRYHVSATLEWLSAIRRPGAERGQSALAATIVALKWLLPIGLFIWWRRRAEKTLETVREKVIEEDRKERGRTAAPSRLVRALDFVKRVRVPLEWLLLIWAIVWLLPHEAQELLEVELASTIFSWTLGGTIVVTAIDFLAGNDSPRLRRQSKLQTAHIRFRSLRLVGRVVVVFGLILALSDKLVGEGTIYSWVFTLCWFAVIPITLVFVKWWRAVIFERVELKRRKSKIDEWVVAQEDGWQSFVAAIVGGAMLFGAGAYRVVRAWVSTFDVTRQILAYLFQRGMSKQAEEAKHAKYALLDRKVFKQLGPATRSEVIVPSVADAQVDEVIKRIDLPGGGVFAIVGERGSGKTTLLKRIDERAAEVVLVGAPHGGMQEFAPKFLEALEAEPTEAIEAVCAELDSENRDCGIVIDNAHRLIRPAVGGFRDFDRLLAMARNHSKNVAWVFAFDEVIWRLLQRMRGTKPLFDDVIQLAPWTEEGIVRLLTARNKAADISPTFEHLVGELPPEADEIDLEEAIARTEENYLRLIWHYSAGNPGMALHVWRTCLGVDEEAQHVVKVFQAPDAASLDGLPDEAMFVLRAIVQLERARPEDICAATQLSLTKVQDVVRYGRVKGYLEESDEGYRITWSWFRAVTVVLQRRHLLFAAGE